MQTSNKSEEQSLILMRKHTQRRYGKVTIQTQPMPNNPHLCQVRVVDETSEIYEVPRNYA